jgi:hypothetical protein
MLRLEIWDEKDYLKPSSGGKILRKVKSSSNTVSGASQISTYAYLESLRAYG